MKNRERCSSLCQYSPTDTCMKRVTRPSFPTLKLRCGRQVTRSVSDRPLNKLGFELLNLGEEGQAITVFKANCALFPDRANTFDSLAYAYAELGKTELAIRYYEQALRVDPTFKSALDGLKKLTQGD